MKISVLTFDLSHNCLGRSHLLAKILERRYEVEMIGPLFGDGIWKPVATLGDLRYKPVKVGTLPESYWNMVQLLKQVDGDVIYASKPLFTSYGIGLLSRIFKNKPLVLDIDDWQLGIMQEAYKKRSAISRLKGFAKSTLTPHLGSSYWNHFIGDKLTHLANEITVSNRYLQKKFGGKIIWHARDTTAFNPNKFDKKLIRENFGIGHHQKILMFFGTPRPFKGLEELIVATSLLKNQDVVLTIVGIDDNDNYSKTFIQLAKEKLGENFKGFGLQSFDKVPEFLAIADVIAIPQRNNSATVGQVPAKVFDAMAMAKPVIATDVSDLPEILDGCGWIVEPEQPESLAQAITYVLEHPEEAEQKGQKARIKCLENYSWDAMENILGNIFEKYQ